MRTALHQVDRVREDGRDERAGAETRGPRAAGENEDHAGSDGACRRARQDRTRADLVPGEPPKRFAESIEALVKEPFDGLVRLVARRDAGAAAKDDGVRFVVFHDALDERGDRFSVIANDDVTDEIERLELVRERLPRGIVGGGARVADRHRDDARDTRDTHARESYAKPAAARRVLR